MMCNSIERIDSIEGKCGKVFLGVLGVPGKVYILLFDYISKKKGKKRKSDSSNSDGK